MNRPDLDRTAADDPVRAVFRRALRETLVLVGAVAVVGIGVGALVTEPPIAGIWGALIGVVVTLVFSGTTVVSMLRTANSSPTTTAVVILGAWLVKMVLLVALFGVLERLTFYDRNVLVAVVLVGVLGSVLIDYHAVKNGRVPYVTPAD
jgi:multisubunit Na+/H+ antiporter MnhF subunit